MELHISSKGIFLLATLQGWFPGSESQDPWVYLPQSITALKGSCVEIPCTINVMPTDFHLIWYREQSFADPEIFNNKNPINNEFKDRTSLVGNKSNSCSLRIDDVRDGGTYYPCINVNINCNKYKGFNKVLVQVSDTPDKPVLKLPTNLTEGAPVRITCSVQHTCTHNPPVPQWNKVGFNKTDWREELEGGVWRFVQEMDYIPTYQDHGTPIICRSEYPMGRVSQESLILNITYSPKNVTISKLDGGKEIKEGDQVTLQCTSTANPPAQNYSWYHIKKERKEELKERGENITVTINWENMKYSCSARNEIGKKDSSIMDLYMFFYAKVVQSGGKQNPREGDTLELECLFLQNNLPSAQYSWYRIGIPLNNETQRILRIYDVKESHSGNYSCEVHTQNGNFSSLSFTVTVTPPLARDDLPMILGGVATIIFILLIGLVLYIFVRSRKFQKTATSAKRRVDTVVQECINPVYENIQPKSHYCDVTVNEEDPSNGTEKISFSQMEREDMYAQPNKKRDTVQYTSIKHVPGARVAKELKHEEIQYASIQH
ncbi:sialoadhesin-like [Xenopus laevis]|uniref:Sialoadhesin-like n=1 Tax=Xenopus laevis TaxID=8355 RepID=A0A8J1LG14_XENLA|nr:sialoadhesin-like [Xenopus laevis]